MSKVLSDWTKETIIETRRTKELVGIKCDKCGQVIATSENNESAQVYYRVKLSEGVSGSHRIETSSFADICSGCLYGYIKNHFENRGLAISAGIEKCKAIKADVHSDRNGNFK